MEEKKRKSSRSFELEKGGKRSFDLNKASARKFDLAKESDEISLEELKKELLADGKIDAEEVNKLRDVLYADGKIDQEEADFIFEINDAVSGKKNAPAWNQFFVQVVSDFLLNDEKSPGVIDEEEGRWLVEKIGADGQVDGVEKQLLDHLKKNAKKMPATVTALLTSAVASNAAPSDSVNLQQLKKEILADGKMDKDEVNQLRKTLYADGKIDQEEADFIFELNDAVSGKKNDPTWNQFFVQVISDYLLNDEKSPGVIDEEEGKWLVEKIGADGQVDGVEKQLLDYLKKNAKKMPTSVAALLNGNTFPPTPPISEGGDQPNGKWKKYAAVLAGLVVLGGVGYYLSQQGDNTHSPVAEVVEQTKSSVATPENSAGTTQDGQDQDGTTTDNATIETSADDASEGGVPANSGQNREGAVPAQTSNAPVTDSETPAKKNPEPVANTSRQNATSTAPVTSVSGAVEEAAKDVIRGKYGNGDVRKRNLGERYAEIQSKVNEMYRKGLAR